ncbi:MAG TPA: hypothetical protein VIV56_14100, partial [Gemmatimonadales bacterium]
MVEHLDAECPCGCRACGMARQRCFEAGLQQGLNAATEPLGAQYGIGEAGRIDGARSYEQAAALAPFTGDKKVYVRAVGFWREV